MLSSQMLWPKSWSFWVAFIASPSLQLGCSRDRLSAREYGRQITGQKIADALDREVGRRIRGGVRRKGKLPLPGEHSGHAVTPRGLDRSQNPRLVVYEDIMGGGIAALDVVEFRLLVDIDQHMAVDRREDPRAFHLARLEDDVAVGQDDCPSPAAQSFENVDRSRV